MCVCVFNSTNFIVNCTRVIIYYYYAHKANRDPFYVKTPFIMLRTRFILVSEFFNSSFPAQRRIYYLIRYYDLFFNSCFAI